ncbi:LacI family DNA-binding transcriptional regulator [Halomonas dongshanensis]|uniref:LacI family DNA-binding transcriptional regulator n=1 Tax=Halomonas dongshanensis TaxID=2890835 RepID=A0ABT2E999_9GAMM|nr:LacI family DNA-binding transcriptional regulator [Halomonas dongshanensis]MCS2608153.1 LacI family DNA-binding transcriptional regulator [Halomonas dongshanensis]
MTRKPSSTPTMVDIAKAAKVGVATVDRVFSGRANVRPQTAEKVINAAKSLGYIDNSETQSASSEVAAASKRRLGFLLQKRRSPVYRIIAESLIETSKSYQERLSGSPIIEYCDTLDPTQVSAALMRLGQRVEAIGVVATDHPEVTQAISRLRQRGVPVFALLSELPAGGHSAAFVGQDARKVGRTSAWAMSRMLTPGPVGIITGSHRYVCQELYEIGFRGYFREKAPDFRVLEPMFSQEDPAVAAQATEALLAEQPTLKGLYVAGGGIEGVVATLREQGRQDLFVVGHDLTATTRGALVEGTLDLLLSLPRQALADQTLAAMLDWLAEPTKFEGTRQFLLPIDIYTPESV